MNIKIARIKKSLTQKQLCELIGIGINSLVKLEKGDFSTLRYPVMKKISEILETSIQELFFNE